MIETLKNYEQEIKKLKLIQDNFITFNSIENFEELLNILLDKSINISKADLGYIILKSSENEPYKISMIKSKILYFDNVLALSDSCSILIDSIISNPNPKFILDDLIFLINHKINSCAQMIFPLNINNKIKGLMCLETAEKNLFNEDNFEILSLFTVQAIQHLDKIKMRMEMERKIKLKNVLINITNNIEKVFVLKDVFNVVMENLADKFGIIRGMLVLFDKEDINRLSVVSAYNLTEEEMSRGIYRVGEGIVGRVVENGKPISVPDINKDSIFLNKMKIKRDKNLAVSFIAVPIKISGIVVGVLAIEKLFESIEILKDEEDMLYLISGIIANKVKIYQKMSEEKSFLLNENINLKKELYKNYGIDNIIGKNKKMEDIFELIKLVADSSSSIMILGQSGTGKEMVAKALHFNSNRRYAPFISINCAAIPENLLESELFGYKKGAFTGANADKKGKFLLADGGTLFLDEIGEMSLYLQAKLLRAIQDKVIEPIGSEFNIEIDIRIISATNKDPKELIKSGKLREDLYYRLNVVEIKLPALKERKDDIPLLTQHFIEKYSKANNKKIKRISHEALRLLYSYHWPGNVRELENIIERAVLLSKGSVIEIADLPPFIVEAGEHVSEEIYVRRWIENFIANEKNTGNIYDSFMNIIEKEFLIKSLLHNNRNKIKTSSFLGINRNTLRAKMKKYNINII